MGKKVHETAVVLIPPEDRWEPIQAIRRVHDRHAARWMPHITLLYPFRPRELFDEAANALRAALADVTPLEVTLREFRHFRHGRSSFTIWLAPEPAHALQRLQAAMQAAIPDCDDLARRGGFTPHLSVGQIRGTPALDELIRSLRQEWEPLIFTANRVSLIWRDAPPDDVFRIDRQVPLGQPGKAVR